MKGSFLKNVSVWVFAWFLYTISGGFSFSVLAVSPPIAPPEHSNIALAAVVDGTFYVVDTNSRKVIWSFQSGEPIYSSYQALPYHDGTGGDTDVSDQHMFYLDCGADWGLYVHGPRYEGGTKLATGAEEFIKQTPMVTAKGGVIVGSKKYTVFLLDAKSERVIHAFNSDNSTFLSQTFDENKILPRKDIEDSLAASSCIDFGDIDQPLFVFRTDYSLKYFYPETKEILWYLRFAEIKALFQCHKDGELFSDAENSFNRKDGKLSNDCQRTVDVYRIHNRSITESNIMSYLPANPHPNVITATVRTTQAPLDLHLAGTIPSSGCYDLRYILGLGGAILGALFVHLASSLLKQKMYF